MASSFVVGHLAVTADEFYEKLAMGTMERFQARARQDPMATLEFREGAVQAADVFAAPIEGGEPLGFQPLGIGKPLSIEILAMYTGNVPFRFGLGKPDLLVTSAVKGVETIDAQPRAVNQLVRDVADRRYIQPSAEAEGSPIVYYTSSLVNSTLSCDINLVADTFDDKALGHLSALLKSAGGLPVFAPSVPGVTAGVVLMAGSVLADVIGNLGKLFLESRPFLRDRLELRFETPDFIPVIPSTIFVYNYEDRAALKGYMPVLLEGGSAKQRIALVSEDENEYNGDAPYVIISLDGRNRDKELEGFMPKLTSAALLERFFGSQDPGGQASAILEQAMQLYNDFNFHKKAQEVKKELASLDPESESFETDKAMLDELLSAYKGNIRDELFQVA